MSKVMLLDTIQELRGHLQHKNAFAKQIERLNPSKVLAMKCQNTVYNNSINKAAWDLLDI